MKQKRLKNVSLADIAGLTGVSRMTVSLALRNDPRVAAATKERVREAAQRIGYQPDPKLASIMATIRQTQERSPVTIGWINASSEPDAWHRYPYLIPYFEGARERCRTLGFELEEFWLQSKGMTTARLSKILFHRGIRGVIISPPHDGLGLGHVRLDWDNFACASFEEKVLNAPTIPRVAQDWFYNMMLALKMLRRYGYSRIGVHLEGQAERRSSHMARAAVHYFQKRIPLAERVPVKINRLPGIDLKEFSGWVHRAKPDVIIGQHGELVSAVERSGYRVPEQIGVVHLALEDDCKDWAGVWACKREIGEMAADAVIGKLQKHDYGLPLIRSDTLIPGRWHKGRTLLLPKPAAA